MANNWRKLKCDGCPLACGYRDFHVFDRDGFRETVQSLYVQTSDRTKWRYKRRGTVLGMMHAHKRDLWEQHTQGCQNYGLSAIDMAVQELTELVMREALRPDPSVAAEFADAVLELDDFVSQTDEVPF